MTFEYKYLEDETGATYNLLKNLEAYCCDKQVKITLTSSEKSSSCLSIEKMPNASENIDIANCFMEFLLFLSVKRREHYTLDRIKAIEFLNMKIKHEFINIILALCSLSDNDYYKDKYIVFKSCLIPKEIKLGFLPCKGASIVMSNCIIEDFKSLNGFNGDYLEIEKSTIQQYTGSVTMNCNEVYFRKTPLNYPYFFLNTILPNIRRLSIYRDEEFDEESLFFIINFPDLYELTLPAIIEDTYCLDQLRNLVYTYGIYQKDPLSQEIKVYSGKKSKILESKHPEIYIEDDDFLLWNQRINDKSLDEDDVRNHIKDYKKAGIQPIIEALEAQKNRTEPFDFKFLSDIGALRVMNTGLPFDADNEGIICYVLDGLYTPKCKLSRVKYDMGIPHLTKYIDNDSIFTSIEKQGLKIIDTRGNFTIEGSIIGSNVKKVRQTITFLQTQKKKEIFPLYEIKKIKRKQEGMKSPFLH